MKTQYRLPMAAVFAVVLALSLPSLAGADSDQRGRHDGGRSSEARRHGQRDQGDSRGDNRDWRGDSSRDGSAGRDGSGGNNRGDNRDWRGDNGRDGSRSRDGWRGDIRYRQPSPDYRPDPRWRDPRGGGGYQPSYGNRTRYRGGAPGYAYNRPHRYYTSFFPRPRFVRSGFSIGFVIGSVAPYGYRFYDPYCEMGFNSLDEYYDHAYDEGHPEVVLLLDARSGYPIATCTFDDGRWVVDDCY